MKKKEEALCQKQEIEIHRHYLGENLVRTISENEAGISFVENGHAEDFRIRLKEAVSLGFGKLFKKIHGLNLGGVYEQDNRS